ncbi:MAG: hypothetical protein SFY69_05785 [Planctomycetota bacterium]|nr:hypothetical protein [Planctomycetota bacterium]
MTSPTDDNLDHVNEHGNAPAFEPRNLQEAAAQGDIMRVLADFQTGLESLKELHRQREALQVELVAKHKAVAERDAQLRAQDERLREQQAEFAQARREHEERREALERALREHEEERARATEASDKARADLEERAGELSALAARLGHQEKVLAESRKRLAEREGEVARLRTELDASLSAAQQNLRRAGDLGQEAAELRAELEQERATNEDLMRQLALAQGRNKGESVRAEDAARRASEVETQVSSLKSANADLEKRLAELTARFKQVQSEALLAQQAMERMPARNDTFLETRRRRLHNYRLAVRRQLQKVRKASEAISKRMEQVDQLLQQRAELAAARQRIIEGEKRVAKARARTRAGVVTLCSVAALSILAGLSWALAREVSPGQYVAEVTLKADGRGRELNEAELEEWRRFHYDMLNDPMFHHAASDRFVRQGLSALGTPAAVSGLITTSVHADSMVDDEIKVTLRGEGQDRTRRILEAFSASLASYANGAQQRRIDGGSTIIPMPAKADDSPVDHSRTVVAGGMMAGGTLFSLVLGLLVWKKLAHAKSSFEHDSTLASVLDEAHWVNPR